MTTTSVVPGVIDYLVTAAAAALPAVTVFDGPQPVTAWQAIEQILWIGADPVNLADMGAEATQDWPVLGDFGRTKDEDGSVTCACRHWSGDTAVKPHRDGAAAILAGVELLLRGEPAQGGPGDITMGGLVMWAGLNGPVQWYPRQVAGGAQVICVFRIVYKARLVTG